MRLALLALFVLPASAIAQQPPPLVAPTDALSPEDERKGFTVPPGFEVQLVASEPQIQKPMQLAFDARGRMWVTTSYHYPFAAPQGKGTDKLFVLSDIDPATGKAGKVQVFADDLNIPIGVLPLPDCKSVIVSSTGEIRKYTDTNDDGKADKMELLFSGFGYVDTHGMTNSFTLMPDGWVYACHGFRNDSKVKGKDGHEVVMNSGHTFRFRPDGSRIEVYTRGQVNPFGIAVDPWFNLYTADCHSKPITQLIPGAYYESFGKPHDGLGFAAHVTRHDHGSTGLCGLAWYDADQFPKDYLGCMFVGNVVTSRINFDKIEWRGATPVAKELPDFMTSKDLWFRPVDIKLGPDGALYISDFYNKIIGHYEVDLKHPGRDKDRGRLWRIVWNGAGAKEARFHRADFVKAKDHELVDDLFHPNLTVRFLAGHQLRQRVGAGQKLASRETTEEWWRNKNPRLASWVGWAAFIAESGTERFSMKDFKTLVEMGKGFPPEYLTGHVVRALNCRRDWGEGERKLVNEVIKSSQSVHQTRACVEAIGFHPHADFVTSLVELLKKCPPEDTHLRYAARVALRNCLSGMKSWPDAPDPIIADIALAIPDGRAAAYLLDQLKLRTMPEGKVSAAAEHVARYGVSTDEPRLFQSLHLLSSELSPEPFLAAFRGIQARGLKLGKESARSLLTSAQSAIQNEALYGPNTTAGETKAANWGLRILNALPTVLDGPANSKPYALDANTVKYLAKAVERQGTDNDIRVASAEALLRYAPEKAVTLVREQLERGNVPAGLRDRFLLVFASSSNKDARLDARDALKDAPYRTAVAVGTALAGTPAGAEDLLDAVKQGKAPARLLQEKAILERLRAAKLPNLDRQIGALTQGLPPLDQKIAELMKKRSVAYTSARPDKELGLKIFTKHCGACHKIGEAGGKIAPQLDGVGNRGLERLLEDTLDPNRNVDQAFRARIITTKDERTITGLMLRVEGEVVVVADAEGKEFRIPTKDIESNRETMLSPMPANFGDAIPEVEFNHLLAYLLEQKAKEPPKK
jgi:putative heme-binding domain-containing protein